MAVIENIKDVLGIFDDAQDFFDAVKKEAGQSKSLFKKFESLTSEQIGLVRRLENERRGPQKVIQIMDQLDIDRPLLFGKNLLRRLQDSRNTLSKLGNKIRNIPPQARADVRTALTKASRQLDRGIKQHIGTIRVFSDIQNQRKRFFRGIAKTGLVVAGGIAAGAVLGTVASTAVRAILSAPDNFSPGTVEVARFFGEGLSELEINLATSRRAIGTSG